MPRFLTLLLSVALLTSALAAVDDIPDPATLPEKTQGGDMDPDYPAEAARRLLAGKALLEKGDLDGAQQEFDKAQKAHATQPMVYFYQAIVAYRRGDYPGALTQAKEGLGVLRDVRVYGKPTAQTDAQEARIDELYKLIEKKLEESGGKAGPDPRKAKQEFETALKEGDEAFGQGLLAKAAAAYARAFRADPTKGELGLRAATLYADRLKNPVEAARLWQKVLAGGEPHAGTARAELQSHRDTLDAVLKAGLAKRDQWRSTLNDTEPLQLAEAFPESAELELALAVIYARKGPVDDMVRHLQAASRLGAGADDFLTEKAFVDYLQNAGLDSAGGQRLASFVRDAYGEDSLTTMRTELKRRGDEIARLAREKAEKERQTARAKELKDLTTWRSAERAKAVAAVNQLISAHNGITVEMAAYKPVKKPLYQHTIARTNSVSFENGQYRFYFWHRSNSTRISSGAATPVLHEELSTLPSFASLRSVDAYPSTWETNPSRMGDPNATIYNVPASPAYQALCKEVSLVFNDQSLIRHQYTITPEYETVDGSKDNSFVLTHGGMRISAMLTDEEIAQLKTHFARLAALDAAGNNLEQLRQLRK